MSGPGQFGLKRFGRNRSLPLNRPHQGARRQAPGPEKERSAKNTTFNGDRRDTGSVEEPRPQGSSDTRGLATSWFLNSWWKFCCRPQCGVHLTRASNVPNFFAIGGEICTRAWCPKHQRLWKKMLPAPTLLLAPTPVANVPTPSVVSLPPAPVLSGSTTPSGYFSPAPTVLRVGGLQSCHKTELPLGRCQFWPN